MHKSEIIGSQHGRLQCLQIRKQEIIGKL
jgi:hypothetical protein